VKGAILVSDTVEAHFGDALEAAAPGVARIVLAPESPRPDPASIEIVYFSGDCFPDRTRDFAIAALKAERLGWLHTFSAGVDNAFFQQLLQRGVRLTTSSGAQAVPIAHTVMLYLLALSRDLRGWDRDQSARRWEPRDVADLQDRTLGVVGLGPIGLEVARLGQAFRMNVIGMRRSPRGDEPCETWPLSQLRELFARCDAIVLALPLADETRGLVNADVLSAAKPGSWFVNIARGEIVDEAALVEALRDGPLAGAGLDVFATEPLPEESPLWSLPNVIVTPHSSGTNRGNHERATEIFLDNLARYVREEPMRNEVFSKPPGAREPTA
jgi:phosphoglycerate dehydrogenase-like enzyme